MPVGCFQPCHLPLSGAYLKESSVQPSRLKHEPTKDDGDVPGFENTETTKEAGLGAFQAEGKLATTVEHRSAEG